MALFARSYNDILQDSLLDLVQNTRITKLSNGAKARAITETMSRQLSTAYKIFDLNLARAFLSGASGRYLDLIGEVLGVSRAGLETARADSQSRTIRFYVDVGTFGDINDAASFTIPRGTTIAADDQFSTKVYKTVLPVVASASSSEVFVAAEAIIPGPNSNVGANILNFHDFIDYEDVDNDSLKVTNLAGIFTGAEVENDTNYRFRIANQVLSAEAANETAIRLAALLVPGVADVQIVKFAYGLGSYRLLIKSTTPSVPDSLIDAVQVSINSATALGNLGVADRPDETGMSFVITLRYKRKLPTDERDSIEDGVRAAIRDYVNNLDIAEDFILNEGVERVLGVSPDILDMGLPTKPFDNVFVYKETLLRDNKIRNELLGNYSPADAERLIIEPSVADPIRILRAN